jgi:hypothetical protein
MRVMGSTVLRAAVACGVWLLVMPALWGGQTDPPSRFPGVDGVVGKDEYGPAMRFKGQTGIEFSLYARTAGGNIVMAMTAPTPGWLALGIEPADQFHKHADMIFGWVDAEGNAHVVDAFSPDTMGPHPDDRDLGGTMDIIAFGGGEANGVTTIEFARPLHLMDHFDHDIEIATPVSLTWAVGTNDDWRAQHKDMGRASLVFRTGRTQVPMTLWPLHAILMISGASFMAAGVIVARKKDGVVWVRTHRSLESVGGLLTIAGAVFGAAMIGWPLAKHFQRLHSYTGILIPLLVAVVLISGHLLLKPGGPRAKRTFHTRLAWGLIVLMASAVIEGFFAVGIW